MVSYPLKNICDIHLGIKDAVLLPIYPAFHGQKKTKVHENIVGKGENADTSIFSCFPQCFLPFPRHFFQSHLFCRLRMLSILVLCM